MEYIFFNEMQGFNFGFSTWEIILMIPQNMVC